eukprot:scaffold3034_cov173-Amphora_coffeaeformis.AAC.18
MSLDSFASILNNIWPRGRGGGRRPTVRDEIDSEASTGSAEDVQPLYLQPLREEEEARLTIVQVTDVVRLGDRSDHLLCLWSHSRVIRAYSKILTVSLFIFVSSFFAPSLSFLSSSLPRSVHARQLCFSENLSGNLATCTR